MNNEWLAEYGPLRAAARNASAIPLRDWLRDHADELHDLASRTVAAEADRDNWKTAADMLAAARLHSDHLVTVEQEDAAFAFYESLRPTPPDSEPGT